MRVRTLIAIAALAAIGLVAGCGDNVNDNGNGAGNIAPGFFIGQTASGEDLSIAVGTIRAVFFRCAGQVEYQRFDPPEPVAGDGSFAVEVRSNGISFVVTGEITSNRIDGAIAGNSGCHGAFVARRCDSRTQDCGDRDGDLIPNEVDPDATTSPTPQRTSTPGVTASGTTAASASPTPAATASNAPTPVVTATPNSALCGNGVLDDGEECDKNVIDNSGCFEDVCTCEDFCADAGGTLSCNSDCTLNFSKCSNGPCEFF